MKQDGGEDARFDSKLVRLKASVNAWSSVMFAMFRFQTGSIKSFHIEAHRLQFRPFRFQTGSIKRKANAGNCQKRN